MNEDQTHHSPEEIEESCRRLDALKEHVPTEDELFLLERFKYPFGKPRTAEQIAAVRARLLEPVYLKFIRYTLWIGGISLLIYLFANFNIYSDAKYAELQRKADERDAIVDAFALNDRAQMFRLIADDYQADLARIINATPPTKGTP
jgi:hypothetical protein